MKIIYDLFNVLILLVAPEEKCSSKQKKENFRDYEDKPGNKKIQLLEEEVHSNREMLRNSWNTPLQDRQV